MKTTSFSTKRSPPCAKRRRLPPRYSSADSKSVMPAPRGCSDLMEAGGYIGPGDGAKPRDVNIEKIEERLS